MPGAIGSSAIGATSTIGKNLVEGECADKGVLESAVLSGITGGTGFALGHATESLANSIAWQNLKLSEKLLSSSNAITLPPSITNIGVGLGNSIGITISNTNPVLDPMVP